MIQHTSKIALLWATQSDTLVSAAKDYVRLEQNGSHEVRSVSSRTPKSWIKSGKEGRFPTHLTSLVTRTRKGCAGGCRRGQRTRLRRRPPGGYRSVQSGRTKAIHQKISTRKSQVERRFDFAKARGTNEKSLVLKKNKNQIPGFEPCRRRWRRGWRGRRSARRL